jgi:hypothetical protein
VEQENELTREIPRTEWVEFLDRFSQQHDGWLVSLQVFDRDMGAQIIAENVPLRGITADLKDREDQISINVGKEEAEHSNHIIENARRIQLQVNAQGAHESLNFESSNGAMTLLQFRVPAVSETVDGVYTSA